MTEKKTLFNIGAVWKKTSQSGTSFLSGKLEDGTPIMIFKNDKKVEGSKQPDYRIVSEVDLFPKQETAPF